MLLFLSFFPTRFNFYFMEHKFAGLVIYSINLHDNFANEMIAYMNVTSRSAD